MNYSLHPEAEEDLRDAAEFYRKRAGNRLSQSLLAEFEQSVKILLQHPGLGFNMARSSSLLHEALSLFSCVYSFGRRNSYHGCCSPQPPSRLLARKKIIFECSALFFRGL